MGGTAWQYRPAPTAPAAPLRLPNTYCVPPMLREAPAPLACRAITAEEIRTFDEDGVVCLRGLFDGAWVSYLRELVAEDMAAPSEMSKNVNALDSTGFFFFDAYICHHLDGFRHAVTAGPGGEAAARVMGASESTLIFDQLLVKEPGTSTETLWVRAMASHTRDTPGLLPVSACGALADSTSDW